MPKLNQTIWKSISLKDLEIAKELEKARVYRLPAGGDYPGWAIMLPKSRIIENVFSYKDFPFVLKHKDMKTQETIEKELTEEDFRTELKKIDAFPKYENKQEYLENCPPTLRNEKKFIVQKLVWDEGKGKFAKIPINPHTGGQAQSNNPETWGTFEQATASVEKFNIKGGIGYVLDGSDGIVGIDLDLDATTHELTPKGKEILKKLKGKTYIEYSSSGAIHILGFGVKPGVASRGAGDSTLEMYGGKNEGNRTLMITGKVYDGKAVPICNIQKEIDSIYKNYFKRAEVQTVVSTPKVTLTEQEVIKKIQASKQADKFNSLMAGDVTRYGGDYSKADLGLCSIIAFYTKDRGIIDTIYRQSELYRADKLNSATGKYESRARKWEELHGNKSYGDTTIDLAISTAGTYEERKNYMQDIEPLKVQVETEKAVQVKYIKEGNTELKESVWLPKSQITLDKDNQVVGVNRIIREKNQIPLKKARQMVRTR